jgi:hypothetical protein
MRSLYVGTIPPCTYTHTWLSDDHDDQWAGQKKFWVVIDDAGLFSFNVASAGSIMVCGAS